MRFTHTLPLACAVSLLSAQTGTLDLSFNPNDLIGGQGDGVWFGGGLRIAQESDSTFLVAGTLQNYNGMPSTGLMRIGLDGKRHPSFAPNPDPVGGVRAIAVQPDGRILVAGQFFSFNGVLDQQLVRLLPDGSLDPTFSFSAPIAVQNVIDMCLLPDGKIIVSGMGTIDSVPYWLMRLHPDGQWDGSFSDDQGQVIAIPQGGLIRRMGNGSLLVSASLCPPTPGGPCWGFVRYTEDGAIDASFSVGTGFNDNIHDFTIDQLGRVNVVGAFTSYNGSPISRLAQLNSSGELVQSFGSPLVYWNQLAFTGIEPLASGELLILTSVGQFHGGASVGAIFKVTDQGLVSPDFGPADVLGQAVAGVELSSGDLIVVGTFYAFIGERMVRQGGIVRTNKDGMIDLSFNRNSGADAGVFEIVPLPDGGAIIGGGFTRYNGRLRNGIARITADGEATADFQGHGLDPEPLYFSNMVKSIALLSDGRIYIGGRFDGYDGAPRPDIARLHADGALDASFNPVQGPSFGHVNAIVPLPDGKVLLGGSSLLGEVGIAARRLFANGDIDASYHNGFPLGSTVESMCRLPSGDVLAGGRYINTYDGQTCGRLVKLDADGNRIMSFQPIIQPATHDATSVKAIVALPEGRILFAGDFTHVDGHVRGCIAVVDENGALDPTFDPGYGFNGPVCDLGVLPDGRIMAAGPFTEFNGAPCAGFARLQPDGALDPSFNAASSLSDYLGSPEVLATCVGVLSDGSTLVGGEFTECDGIGRNRILKLRYEEVTPVHSIELAGLGLCPNPSDGRAMIRGLQPGLARLTIADLDARNLIDMDAVVGASGELALDAGEKLAPGCYLVTAYQGGAHRHARMIVTSDRNPR